MSVDLTALLRTAAQQVSESSLLELTELLWTSAKPFTFPALHATGRHVSAKLREWGVRSRAFELPADGKTVLGDWRMPLAWECHDARLEIHDPYEDRGKVLADTRKHPHHVIRWSGPTPPQALIGEVVRIEDQADFESRKDAVRNRIVYTPSDPRPFKKMLADTGALAVVTSYSAKADNLHGECDWLDSWSDEPAGWAFHDGDAPLPGMVISPAAGIELDVLVERGRVRLKLKVDSKYEESTCPVLCGYIDAELQEEVLALSQVMGPGANTHAAGGAVVLESLRVLQEATQSGKLPPLRRAVRGLLVNRGYGTVAFAVKNPGIIRRMLAGVNWEAVGRYQEAVDASFTYLHCPEANPSVADVLLEMLLETWQPEALPYVKFQFGQPYAPAENMYGDPLLNVHCPAVTGRDRFGCTSADTLERLNPKVLHFFATVSVAYLHFLATATAKEAVWLVQQTVRRYGARLEDLAGRYAALLDEAGADKPAILARACDHLTYLREIEEKTVLSAKRFLLREERATGHLTLLKYLRHTRRLLDLEKRRLKELAGCEPAALPPLEGLGDLAALRPFKKFVGTPAYEAAPLEAKAHLPSPLLNAPLHAALFWADGKLTFAEILRRVGYEYGGPGAVLAPAGGLPVADLVAHFTFMGEQGLLQWLQPGEAIPKPPKPEEAGEAAAPVEGEAAVAEAGEGAKATEDVTPADEAEAEGGAAEPEATEAEAEADAEAEATGAGEPAADAEPAVGEAGEKT